MKQKTKVFTFNTQYPLTIYYRSTPKQSKEPPSYIFKPALDTARDAVTPPNCLALKTLAISLN